MEKNWNVKIGGMSCSHCVARVGQALREVSGTIRAEVDLATGTAKVVYDDTRTEPSLLAAAVSEAGYEVLS